MSDDAADAAEAKRAELRRRDAAGARRRRAARRIVLDDERAAAAEAALNHDSDASRPNSVGNSVAGNVENLGGDVDEGEYMPPPVRHSTLLDLQIRRAAKACAMVEADRTIPLIEKARVHISAIGALARGVEKQEHTERLLALEKRLDARDRRR